jgi:hypothetical protein
MEESMRENKQSLKEIDKRMWGIMVALFLLLATNAVNMWMTNATKSAVNNDRRGSYYQHDNADQRQVAR